MLARWSAFLAVLVVPPIPHAGAAVVHRKDGARLIGPMRPAARAGFVRVDTVDGIADVPLSEVSRVEKDADLVAVLVATRQSVDGDDAKATLRFAYWAARKGLFEDALELADRALTLDPSLVLGESFSSLPVLGVHRDERIGSAVAWRLLRATVDPKRPATARLALARISSIASQWSIEAALERGLSSGDPALRANTLEVLERSTPPELWTHATRMMLFDPEPAVRTAATRAVAAYDDPRVVIPLQRALLQGGPELREAAMDAVESLGERRAAYALVHLLRRRAESSGTRAYVHVGEQRAFVSDFDVDVANSAFVANPNIGVLQIGAVLETSLLATSRPFPAAHRARAARILAALTGQDFGTDAEKWSSWLARAQDD